MPRTFDEERRLHIAAMSEAWCVADMALTDPRADPQQALRRIEEVLRLALRAPRAAALAAEHGADD